MISTLVLVAALAAGYDPGAEVHKVPGPAFLIPCKVEAAEVVAVVQLYVSADRGKTWALHEEIKPAKGSFTFVAKKAGEYWFAPRIQKKDGTYLPSDPTELAAAQRVAVAVGSADEDGPPVVPPLRVRPRAGTARDTADELDEELTRVELEMIRKEIKRLGESNSLTPDVEEKIDRLRSRLYVARDRGRRDRDPDPLVGPPRVAQPWAFPPATAPVPYAPPTIDDTRLPPPLPSAEVPTISPPPDPVPVRPAAPPPRIPVTP